MATRQPAPDETSWSFPPFAQHLGGINTNTVHLYFYESGFFDRTSNNATLLTQARYNPALAHVLQSRAIFEERVRTMSGLEFMVVQEPQPVGAAPGEDTGVWVIRKQSRQKRPGMEDELTTLGTYYILGETVYQAPSVRDIIGYRLLNINLHLSTYFTTASTLPIFTPSLGHTYSPPIAKPLPTSTNPNTGTAAQGTREPSLATTPMPDASTLLDPTGARTPKPTTTTTSAATKSAHADARLLSESLSMAIRYKDEFMDENPLVGEPGAFRFTATNERLVAERAARKVAEERARAEGKARDEGRKVRSRAGSPEGVGVGMGMGAGVGVGVGGEIGKGGAGQAQGPPAQIPVRKASRADVKASMGGGGLAKPKRRKSKAPTSPTTPVTGA